MDAKCRNEEESKHDLEACESGIGGDEECGGGAGREDGLKEIGDEGRHDLLRCAR